MEPNETYLGDAVFASFDGWQVKLRTGDGNHQVIFLEPNVYAALERYVKTLTVKFDGDESEAS